MTALSKQDVNASLQDLRTKKAFLDLIEVATVLATGTAETDAAHLTASVNVVTLADGTVGVILPRAKRDTSVEVINTVSNQTLKVYPDTGAQINALTATTGAFSQVGGARAIYVCDRDLHWYVAAANLTGTSTAASTAELDVLASATSANSTTGKAAILGTSGAIAFGGAVTAVGSFIIGAADMSEVDLEKLDGITNGTQAANKAIVNDANTNQGVAKVTQLHIGASGSETQVNATAAEINAAADQSAQAMTTGAGAGITDGVGTIYKNGVVTTGTIKKTSILLDLTGLGSSTTDLDIIGSGVSAAYFGRVLAAQQGTVLTVQMTCLEAPAGGVTDIDLYSCTEGTGVFDQDFSALTETALLTAGGAWTNGKVQGATVAPAANEYLYLACGAAGTPGTYTAGKFLIEICGY